MKLKSKEMFDEGKGEDGVTLSKNGIKILDVVEG
jgi:hypothetical protein